MGVEVVKSEVDHVYVEDGSEENTSLLHEMEKGKMSRERLNEPIKFGSHGTDEPVKGEVNDVPKANFPKDAVDEWPAPKQILPFYFMKYRSYDDQKLKARLNQADKELQKKNETRYQITEKLRAKRADRGDVITQLKELGVENKQFRTIMDGKRKEMEPLQQALGKLRGTNNAGRERGMSLCSSEKELNDLIKSFQYRIQHESIPLSEEKQILREIKQLEGTREKVIANADMKAKIQDSMGEKEVIQDQVKLIGVDLDGVRKQQQVVKAKVRQLEEEKEAIEKDINSLEEELKIVTQKRDQTYENIQELRKQREEGNTCFYQNRSFLNKAKEIAAKKDKEALKELATEVDKFWSNYSQSKAFRDDYEKRMLSSLDIRQLSRDARMRNPDEKLIVVTEAPSFPETETVAKTKAKLPKEDTVSPSQYATPVVQKLPKDKNSKNQKEANNKLAEISTPEQSDLEEKEGSLELEKLQKVPPPKGNEIDEAKMKEMKREEEMAKAKQALERKKKLAEKAAAKAAIKAEKEAEKKLKEREKRVKKKAGASAPPPDYSKEPTEPAAQAAEPEIAGENVEVPAPVPSKNKDRKENTIRNRGRPRGGDSLQKVILKRKKSTNYWVWAAPAAAVFVVLVLAVGYNYLL